MKQQRRKHRPPVGIDAFSIPQFCERHSISVAYYYELRKRGLAPEEMRLGGRVLISRESAERWRERLTESNEEVRSGHD